MLTLRPSPKIQAPSRLGYRYRRFLFSKTWWAITRICLPLFVISFVLIQIVTSENIRNSVVQTRDSLAEWFAFLPGLKIEELQIENATLLQEYEVLQALDIEMPNSILLVDREALRKKMASFDEVGDTSFRFGFNGKLYVDLHPRVPQMIYLDGNEMITVDQTGHRVELLGERADRAELFVVSGEAALDAAEEALELIDALKPFSSKTRGLVRMGARRWDIVLVNGARLMLPEEEPLKALSEILKEHQKSDVLNRDIEAYDMRDPARPVLRLPAGALEVMEEVNLEQSGQSV